MKKDATQSLTQYIYRKPEEGSIIYILAPVTLAIVFKVLFVAALAATL